MKKHAKAIILLVLALAGAVLCGCAHKRGLQDDPVNTSQQRARRYFAASEEERLNPDARNVLLRTAKAQLGTPYVSGGNSPGGFDCSGFVQWTYNQVGVKLPRTAREQAQVGRPVHARDMKIGDIVAFRHPKRGWHTGIYVGDGKFIHSPRKRKSIQVNALSDPYFNETFLGARRVPMTSSEADLAHAKQMLRDYRAQEKNKRLAVQGKPEKSKKSRYTAQNTGRKKSRDIGHQSGKVKEKGKKPRKGEEAQSPRGRKGDNPPKAERSRDKGRDASKARTAAKSGSKGEVRGGARSKARVEPKAGKARKKK